MAWSVGREGDDTLVLGQRPFEAGGLLPLSAQVATSRSVLLDFLVQLPLEQLHQVPGARCGDVRERMEGWNGGGGGHGPAGGCDTGHEGRATKLAEHPQGQGPGRCGVLRRELEVARGVQSLP